jgi:hypothetical protein
MEKNLLDTDGVHPNKIMENNFSCKKISTQEFKLLGEVLGYNLLSNTPSHVKAFWT